MAEQLLLCEQMAAVRNRGLANAQDLAEEVERLGDWREHVRAHPVPMVIAAAAAAYWLVPVRRTRTPPHGQPTKAGSNLPAAGNTSVDGNCAQVQAKTSAIAGFRGAAMGFVGSLIGNAVRNYVAEQLHTLIQDRGKNATPD